MSNETESADDFKPQNVLGMATKSIYLTDPMNAPKDTSLKSEPEADNADDTLPENPDKGENHDWKKRWSDLKTHYDTQKNTFDSTVIELKTQLSELKTQLNSERDSKRQMPKTSEEFKTFREKYPELADMVMTAAMMAVDEDSKTLRDRLKDIEETTIAVRAKEGLNELKKFHEDAEELRDDPKFIAWFQSQPAAVQALIQSPDPKIIAEGIDLYKFKMGLKKSPKERADAAKEATRTPPPANRVKIEDTGKRVYKESEIQRMSDKEFEKNMDDIKAAQYEGRILKGQ